MIDRPLVKIQRLNPALFKFVVELREVKVRGLTVITDLALKTYLSVRMKKIHLLIYDQQLSAALVATAATEKIIEI